MKGEKKDGLKDGEYISARKGTQDVNPKSIIFAPALLLLVERSPIREKGCVGRRWGDGPREKALREL